MAFRVGQKVVCVDAKPRRHSGPVSKVKIVVGAVYTIRAIKDCGWEGLGVWLDEIVEDFNAVYNEEWGYHANRFRPVVERKIELPACITALLDPKNHPPVEKERVMSPGG